MSAEDPSEEQNERRVRSIDQLIDQSIPVLDNLPVIAGSKQSLRRSEKEIAERALALMIVAVKGETGDQNVTRTIIEQYGAEEYFTPAERSFVDNMDTTEQQRVEMSWRYEGVNTLLWALGFVDELSPPDQIADAAALGTIFRELGFEGLIMNARLRSQIDLLDMADLVYRMNWAVVDARINDRPTPGRVDPGIVYERHYALNWLYGYAGLAWDEMRTDT